MTPNEKPIVFVLAAVFRAAAIAGGNDTAYRYTIETCFIEAKSLLHTARLHGITPEDVQS